MYLFHARPDIGFVVTFVSQCMNNPTEERMEVVLRILKYLKGGPLGRDCVSANPPREIYKFTGIQIGQGSSTD